MPWIFSSLAFFLITHLVLGHCTSAEAGDQLTIAGGQPGSEEHRLGVGLSSLVKVVVLPKEGIDLHLASEGEEIGGKHLLVHKQDDLSRLLEGQPAERFRSIMAFRAEHVADSRPIELVAHADISPDAIYHVTRAIFENGPFLNDINERTWHLSFEHALQDLKFPIHPGALRFYQESGGLEQKIASEASYDAGAATARSNISAESTFFVYFDDDQTDLDGVAREQIAAACDRASTSKASQMHISGKTAAPAIGAVNGLAEKRVRAVMDALGLDVDCTRGTTIVASDESGVTLPADLLDSGDDRVGITIMVSNGTL